MKPSLQKNLLSGLLAALILASCVRPAQPVRKSTAIAIPKAQVDLPTAALTPLPTATPPPTPTPQPAQRIHAADQSLLDGDWEKALQEYQNAAQSSADSVLQAEGILGSARCYLMARNEYSAVETLRELIMRFPDTRQSILAHFFLAQAYERQEKYSDAAQEYRTFLEKHDGAINAYIHTYLADDLFAAADYTGAVESYQSAINETSVLDELSIRMKMARSYALSGDSTMALALYDDIYHRTSNDYTRALVDLRKGQIYTELGQAEKANAVYLDAVDNYPQSYDTYSALVALVEAGVQVDELQRGIIDYNAGQYGPALAALDHYLQSSPASPALAHYYYGLTSAAQGNYEEAIRQWDIVIQSFTESSVWDKAWEMKAYTQWYNQDLYSEAIQTLTTFVEKAPSDPRAAEFLFDAAQVADRDNQLQKAIELYERQASVYPDDEHTTRSRFLAALARYRLKDYSGAADAFRRAQTEAVTLEDKAASGFWLGKTLQAAGDSEGAQAAWQIAAAIEPTGYYSERARDQVHDRNPFEPPESYDLTFDLTKERQKAAEWVKTTFKLPEDTDLLSPGDLVNDPYLLRSLELWELGLYDEARGEFEVLRTLSQNDAGRTFRLANLFLDLGAYRSAIMSARRVLDLAGMDDITSLSAPPYFNHVRFGTYYSDLVMPLARQYSFHPLFLYALIRQESLFEGFVNSSAGARGLMQIIPQTGQEIVSNLGWPDNYTDADLYRPLVNLTFGVEYLDRQRKLFDGNLFAALAAYNGGPGNATEWLKQASDDPDLFVEQIRFEETRTYIRRIYENFVIYRMIYNRTP